MMQGLLPAGRRLVPLAFAALMAGLASGKLEAHSLRPALPPPPGIEIPSLDHGQMAVIARHRAAILALAGQLPQTDPTFRRLLNHGNLQYAYCLWGLMPGSISDEQSPFNACSHAYLAAAKALLIHMKAMAAAQQSAEALISGIDADLVQSGSSWVLCQYSADTFSTGAIVEPRWRELVFHGPSLLALALPAIALVAATGLIFGPSQWSSGQRRS